MSTNRLDVLAAMERDRNFALRAPRTEYSDSDYVASLAAYVAVHELIAADLELDESERAIDAMGWSSPTWKQEDALKAAKERRAAALAKFGSTT
jgi:hypothetical protein